MNLDILLQKAGFKEGSMSLMENSIKAGADKKASAEPSAFADRLARASHATAAGSIPVLQMAAASTDAGDGQAGLLMVPGQWPVNLDWLDRVWEENLTPGQPPVEAEAHLSQQWQPELSQAGGTAEHHNQASALAMTPIQSLPQTIEDELLQPQEALEDEPSQQDSPAQQGVMEPFLAGVQQDPTQPILTDQALPTAMDQSTETLPSNPLVQSTLAQGNADNPALAAISAEAYPPQATAGQTTENRKQTAANTSPFTSSPGNGSAEPAVPNPAMASSHSQQASVQPGQSTAYADAFSNQPSPQVLQGTGDTSLSEEPSNLRQGDESARFNLALQAGTSPSASQATGSSLSGPQTSLHLAPLVGSPAWSQALSRELAVMSRPGNQQMSLQLNPAELGPVLVELKVQGQEAQLQFFSSQLPVRQALEIAIPQLREALENQGLSLGEAQVNDDPRQQADQQQHQSGSRTFPGDAEPVEPQSSTADLMAGAAQPSSGLNGGVNLYV